MELWHEYELALVGTTVVATVRWYRTDDPAEEPVQTDTFRFSLMGGSATPGRVFQEFKDRREQIIHALETFDQIMALFGSNQNERRTLG